MIQHMYNNPNNKFLFGVFYPLQLISIISFFLIEINWIAFFIGWVVFGGLGVAVTLHRIISHKAIKVKSWIEPILFVIATLSLQGSPLVWAGIHRSRHHKYADTPGDAHSPKDGLLHAYIGWIHNDDLNNINPKFIIDLLRNKMLVWLHKNGNYLILGTFLVGAVLDFQLTISLWIIPAALSFHQEALINVFCHSGKFGYKTYDTADNTVNFRFLSFLTWGHSLHNNHHYRMKNYDFSLGNKKEFDPCILFLPLIKETSSSE